MKKKTLIKKCAICGKRLNIKKQKIGSNKGKASSKSVNYSEEGVYYEEGNVWFCNSDWKILFDTAKVDYKKFL